MQRGATPQISSSARLYSVTGDEAEPKAVIQGLALRPRSGRLIIAQRFSAGNASPQNDQSPLQRAIGSGDCLSMRAAVEFRPARLQFTNRIAAPERREGAPQNRISRVAND